MQAGPVVRLFADSGRVSYEARLESWAVFPPLRSPFRRGFRAHSAAGNQVGRQTSRSVHQRRAATLGAMQRAPSGGDVCAAPLPPRALAGTPPASPARTSSSSWLPRSPGSGLQRPTPQLRPRPNDGWGPHAWESEGGEPAPAAAVSDGENAAPHEAAGERDCGRAGCDMAARGRTLPPRLPFSGRENKLAE